MPKAKCTWAGEKIIFASNHPEPRGREFELWMIDLDGANLERITYSEGFDGFPMWAPDGETAYNTAVLLDRAGLQQVNRRFIVTAAPVGARSVIRRAGDHVVLG